MKEKYNKIDRRDFLKTAGAAGLAGAFASAQVKAEANEPNVPQKNQELKFPQVPKRKLGKTGVEVPCLSMGTIYNVLENQLVLQKAFQWGVRLWDTAPDYAGPNSELGIGKFISDNPGVRKQLFLITKASDTETIADVEQRLQGSLKRMNTKYIDLYYIMDHIKAPTYNGHGLSDPAQLTDELKQWVESAKKRQLIRFFGFSTHKNMPECLNAAAKIGWIDAITPTYNYRLMQNAEMQTAVEACHKVGIGLIAMKTQAHWPKGENDKKLYEHFLKKGFTEGQAKIKVVLEDERFSSACLGMQNVALLTENVTAVLDKNKLSQTDRQVFAEYARATCRGYCAGCGHICDKALPDTPCVSEIMRYLMYYNGYGQHDRARQLFAKIDRRIIDKLPAIDYTTVEARCPQHLPISRLVAEAISKLA